MERAPIRFCAVSAMVIMLVMATQASGTPIHGALVTTGFINGEPVTFSLDNTIDSISGVFAGTFQIVGDPSFIGGIGEGFFGELTIPPWDYKLLWKPPVLDASIYELSGFYYDVTMTTTFLGDPRGSFLGAVEAEGDATEVSFEGEFVETVGAFNPAPLWGAVTNFFPRGPGAVGFDTLHLVDGVTPFSRTTGEIIFVGNPDASLRRAFITDFSVEFAFTDDDPTDGVLAGTLAGQVALVPAPASMTLVVLGTLGLGLFAGRRCTRGGRTL